MYKLIAIDLDGTLLNSDGDITEYNKKAINNKTEQGIKMALASGRNISAIKNIAKELNTVDYIISGDGAIIYDFKNEKIIYENCIPKVKALSLMQICIENSITYSVYTENSIIADTLKHNVLYYYRENLKKDETKKTNLKIVKDIYEYVQNMEDEHILNISICDDDKSIFNSVLNKLNKIPDIEVLEVSHISRKTIKNGTEIVPLEYYYTEISNKDVNKWNAIKFLLENLNIHKDEVIAIGDNINDRQMLTEAGIGIAMKGSSEEITSIANIVTDFDNNNDGVGKILEQF